MWRSSARVHRALGRADAGARGPARRGARRPPRGLRRLGAQRRAGEPRLQQVAADLEAQLGEAAPARSGTSPKRRAQAVARFLRDPRARGRLPPRRGLRRIQPRAVAELEAEADLPRPPLRVPGGGDGPRAFSELVKSPLYAGGVMDPGRRAPAPAGLCKGPRAGGRGGGRHDPRAERGDAGITRAATSS
jgi:hypothetical protein